MSNTQHYLKWVLFYSFIVLGSVHADWSSSPTTIDNLPPSSDASSSATIVADSLGNLTAAWLENAGGGTVVEASFYSITSHSWSTPAILDQDSAAAAAPKLVVDQQGIATAVWLEYRGGGYMVQAARLSGTSWTPPTTLSSGSAPLFVMPLLVVDPLGKVTVVWFEQQGGHYVVQAARFSGGSWTSSPSTLDGGTANADVEVFPQIGVDASGDVTVAWVENLGSNLALQAARFSEGAWTAAVTLNDGIQTPNAFPSNPNALQMVVDSNGNVTVTWLENALNPVAVQVARFTSNSSPTPTPIPGHLSNLSARALILSGNNVLIAGFIIGGTTSKEVVLRALGPELHGRGVAGELQDPMVDLYDGHGTILRSNDNWHSAPNHAQIQASGLAPTDNRESAIMMMLPPGNFTAIVRGVNGTTGIALVEVYTLL